MNVIGPIRSHASAINGGSSSSINKDDDTNNLDIQLYLYDEAPTVELSLDQFEIHALKRLKVLRKLERVMSSRTVSPMEGQKAMGKILKQELETPQVDQISHFILRAAYSMDEEKRRWFLQHETALFKHRLETTTAQQLSKICKLFQFNLASAEELQQKGPLSRMLLPPDKTKKNSAATTTTTRDYNALFKVPFTQALDLVSKRQCIVEQGVAYVPFGAVVSMLTGKFRMQLSASLAHLAQKGVLQSQESTETERLYPLLKNMNSCLLEHEPAEGEALSSYQASHVTPNKIPALVPHMPLCMRTMQTGLKQDKKLRYHARLQYGLFLKGAGLSLEDAMVFFQRSFSNMTPEQFQKEYGYNIRHIYGTWNQHERVAGILPDKLCRIWSPEYDK